MEAETAKKNLHRDRIDFHVHLGLYTYHHSWVTEWMKKTHPVGYESYIEHYNDPGHFEEFLADEGVDYACILAELNPVSSGICTNEQVRDFCRNRKETDSFLRC